MRWPRGGAYLSSIASDAGSGALVLRVHRAKLFSDLPHLAHQPIIAVVEPSRRVRHQPNGVSAGPDIGYR
jgi:hypothetical protein